MSNGSENKMLEVVSQLSKIMPEEVEPDHLAAFTLTILHGYMDTKDVIVFLRGVADVCEENAGFITEHIERYTGNVADES